MWLRGRARYMETWSDRIQELTSATKCTDFSSRCSDFRREIADPYCSRTRFRRWHACRKEVEGPDRRDLQCRPAEVLSENLVVHSIQMGCAFECGERVRKASQGRPSR